MHKIAVKALKYSILLVGAFAALFPFYWMFITSLKTAEEAMYIHKIVWWPSNPRWENFIEIWNLMNDPASPNPLARAFLNSVIVIVSRTLLVLFASSLTAYALAKYNFQGRNTIFKIIIATIFISPILIGFIPSMFIIEFLGLYNTYWALIIPGFVNAYSVFFLRQYMITIPDELIETARICGCSEFGIFWRIVLPLSKPALATIGVLNAFWTWNDYLWPLQVIAYSNVRTVPLALAGLWESRITSEYMPFVAAATTIATIPIIILAAFLTQKYFKLLKEFIKGLTGLKPFHWR